MSPATTTFLRAAAHDAAHIAAIEVECFGAEAWSPAMVAATLADSCGRSFLAALSLRTVAWAGLRLVGGEAELLRIATLPAARGRGIGRGLLRHALRSCGEPPCHLEVRADNVAAIGLYRQLGFADCGRRKGYYTDGVDALLMTRQP